MTLPVVVRPAAADEENWILSSWKKDAAGAEWARKLDSAEYWAVANHVVDRLARSATAVVVAALEETPDVAIGWTAVRAGRILYTFVKPRFRGLDIEARLRDALPAPAEWRGGNLLLELKELPCK